MVCKDMVVIYHEGCADGFAAAWAAWRAYFETADYIPAQYKDEPPNVEGKDVLIVDFSYPREVLLKLKEQAKSIRVFDHHKTAKKDLEGLDFCVFDMDRSGAGITWDELFKDQDRPKLINYVEDRDLWRFKLQASKEINAYIGTQEHSFTRWCELRDELEHENSFAAAEMAGHCVLQSIEKYVETVSKEAFTAEIAGYKIPVVNIPYIHTSEVLEKLAKNNPFAMSWYLRADGKYKFSLRSHGEIDVSIIAKKYGGGGHSGAAGFISDGLCYL